MSIFEHVLLTRRDDKLFFTTATSESQLTIPAPLTIASGNLDAPVALPLGGMVSYLASLPDCVVTVTLGDDHSLVLDYCLGSDDKVKTGKASLVYLDGNEFPIFPELSGDITHIQLPSSLFINAVEQAKNFSGNDPLRVVLNCLCVDVVDAAECYLVASNGHTLIKYTHTGSEFLLSGSPTKILISNVFFRPISAFAGCEHINVQTNGQTIRIASGDIDFRCKNVEGRYPNYNSVIPRENPHTLVFDKKELLSVIKRISIFGSVESQLISLGKNGMFLDCNACNFEASTTASEQVFLTDAECPDNFKIGVHSAYITNVISAIDSDTIRFHMSDPSKPIVVTADEPSPRVLTLAMPMLLN